jgi:hypothetical protein
VTPVTSGNAALVNEMGRYVLGRSHALKGERQPLIPVSDRSELPRFQDGDRTELPRLHDGAPVACGRVDRAVEDVVGAGQIGRAESVRLAPANWHEGLPLKE